MGKDIYLIDTSISSAIYFFMRYGIKIFAILLALAQNMMYICIKIL